MMILAQAWVHQQASWQKDTKSLPAKVSVYEMTEKGLAAQAMLNGYKYWPDDDLNKK